MKETDSEELPEKDDWGYLGKWVARKLGIKEEGGIYPVMGEMHCLCSDANMLRDFVRLQKVHLDQHEIAELQNLRYSVRAIKTS